MPSSETWEAVPFHYWTFVFFVFGCIVGSFLNVCIYRMPREESISTPPSHCPACGYQIPWHLNIPLVSWIQLGGRCANCGISISPRYVLVEFLTGIAFMCSWLALGPISPGMAIATSILMSLFIVATLIDYEHLIIPDEITLGGAGAGIAASFLAPSIHGKEDAVQGLVAAVIGSCVGAGVVFLILTLGKWMFGRKYIQLEGIEEITFTETAIHTKDQIFPFEDMFFRKTDVVTLKAERVELADRCYRDVPVSLSPEKLVIGEEEMDPDPVRFMRVHAPHITLPQEAMGLGDVKFMATIGAFLGWQGTFFTLFVSATIGAVVGIALMSIQKSNRSTYIPYGPYLALAATIWVFLPIDLRNHWLSLLNDNVALVREMLSSSSPPKPQ